MNELFAFNRALSTWGLADFLKALLILVGVVAVTAIILRVLEWYPPAWVVQIFWICLAVVIGIIAIDFLLSL